MQALISRRSAATGRCFFSWVAGYGRQWKPGLPRALAHSACAGPAGARAHRRRGQPTRWLDSGRLAGAEAPIAGGRARPGPWTWPFPFAAFAPSGLLRLRRAAACPPPAVALPTTGLLAPQPAAGGRPVLAIAEFSGAGCE